MCKKFLFFTQIILKIKILNNYFPFFLGRSGDLGVTAAPDSPPVEGVVAALPTIVSDFPFLFLPVW